VSEVQVGHGIITSIV